MRSGAPARMNAKAKMNAIERRIAPSDWFKPSGVRCGRNHSVNRASHITELSASM